MTLYAYSIDGEKFLLIEDFNHELYDLVYSDGEVIEAWRGEVQRYSHEDFICIDQMIESMQERAYDEADESSFNYLENLTPDDKKELKKMIVNFLKDKCREPNFFSVEKAERVEFVVGIENEQ